MENNEKEYFEANMLDGDKVEDCGGAMLSAASVLEYVQERVRQAESRVRAETEKAFGGCLKCYGKGYSTQLVQEEGYEDFGGEGYVKKPKVTINCCSCERGASLLALLSLKEE